MAMKPISTKGLTKDLIDKFSILTGAKYFPLGIFQNYFVFLPSKKYIKYLLANTRIYSWKCNEMSGESLENITKSDGSFPPTFVDNHLLPDMNFNGECLIKNISIAEKVINLRISYILRSQLRDF